MAITTTQAQGLVLALFGASAGGHLTGLAAASNLNTLAGDLSTSAGLILGKDLSSNTSFRDHVTANLKLSGDALTAANAWLDGQLNAGAARGDIIATAVTFLSTLTDTTSPFYASAQAFQSTVTAAVAWSTGAGATQFGVAALRAQQGNVDVVAGSTFTLTTATAGDQVVGTAGNDVITGTSSTYGSADVILDSSSTDSDTLNLTLGADITATPTVVGVEKINVAFSGFTAAGASGGSTSATSLDIAADNIGVTNFDFSTSGSTAVTQLNVTGLATGSSVTASTQFSTVLLDGDDNAALTLNKTAAASTVTTAVTAVAGTGALTNLTIAESVGALTLTSTDADGAVSLSAAKAVTVTAATDATALTVTAGGNVTITDANSAKTVSISTTAGTITATANSGLAAATSVTLSASKKVVANIGTATEATISAAGVNTAADTTLKSDIGSATLKTVNLSGNGAAAEFDLVDANAVATINVSGGHAVTIGADLTDLDDLTDGLTLTRAGTGAVTLSLAGDAAADVDLSKVDVATAIVLTADQTSTETIKLAPGAVVTIDADQAAVAFTAASSTAATNTASITVDHSTATTSTRTITNLTTTNIKTVSLDMSKDTATTTLGTVDVGAANSVEITLGTNALTAITDITATKATFTGSGALTLGDLTIGELDASGHTGAISYTSAAGDVVRTGSGADAITVGSATDVYVLTGAGNDTVTLAGDNSSKTVYIDMGDGTGDHLRLTDGGNYNAATVSATGVEKITFLNVVEGGGETGNIATVRDTLLDGSTAAIFGTTSVTDTITIGLSKASNDFSALAIDTATIQSGDKFVINAATRTAAVTITGTDASDEITGSNGTGVWVSDTLNGGDGDDTIKVTEGGDAVIGGAGTDTIDLTVIDDAFTTIEGSTSTATGLFVNLSTAAVTKTVVATNLSGSHIAGGLTTAAAGTFGYLFGTESATAPTTVGTVATVENVTGTTGADYIVGSTGDNVITGGVGADFLTGGSGADTYVMLAADAGDTISDFAVAADKIDYNTALVAIGGAGAVVYQAGAADTVLGATTTVFELTGVTTAGSAANLVSALGTTATNANIDANDSFLIVNYLTGGGAQVWRFLDASGADIAAGELTLLVTLTGVAADAVVTDNFI